MRVAYLVMSHRAPVQVERLLRKLRAGSAGAALVSHHDPRGEALDAGALRELGVRRVEPATAIEWGTGSQLRALLNALRFAVDNEAFDWLVHLSGQDYPLKPINAIERELAAADVDGFIEQAEVGPLDLRRRHVDEFVARYRYTWRRSPVNARHLAFARPLLLARGRRVAHPALRPPRERLHRGSDWFTLNRRAVAAVLQRADLLGHFDRTLAPTEAFPHTVLWNRTDLRLSGDTRRYTAWRPGSPHPETLGHHDLDAALASNADFARKFDDPAVLDALDARSERLGA
jgi:hypothetical protein